MDKSLEAKRELARRELARRHLSHFIKYMFPDYRENWHHREITEKLEALDRGEIKKLAIFMPPQHGKSNIVSTYFPAWYFGRHPEKHVIATSYNTEFAVGFGRKVRNIVDSPEYQRIFKTTLAEDAKAAGQWITNGKGEYTATGIGGGVTGRRADCFIIDDPVKDPEEAASFIVQERNYEWYQSVATTRLSPQGAIVLVQTRWHDGDLAGKILEKDPDWVILDFPAIAEKDEPHRKMGEALWADYFTLPILLQKKKDMPIASWSALYQQRPVSEESQIFKKTYFRYRDWEDVNNLKTRRFVTIDPAPAKSEKSDYIGVCENYVDKENYWNLKAYRMKFDAAELIKLMFKLWEEVRPECIGIEKGMYKDVVKPFLDEEMRKRNKWMVIKELDHGQRSKENRIKGLQPLYESKSIFHIKGECGALEEEALRFPKNVHDDVLDAVAYQVQLAEAPSEYTEERQRAEIRDEERMTLADYGL